MSPARHRLIAFAVAAAAAAVFLPCTPASGQPGQLQVAGADAPEGASKEANQGVYVRDSAVAAEKLALGQRMERLKEWDKAADVFQEILEKYPDRVVQSTAAGRSNQYTSVVIAVQERLAKWPDDGLRAYKNRYEAPAADLLAQARRDDYAALNTVFQRYFVTDAGKTAGIRMMDLALENGEFAAAAWIGERLLQWHPNLTVERPKILYRTAIAYHMAGDAQRAKAKLDELETSAPNATGTVRGHDVVLAKSLEQELKQPGAMATNLSAEVWPVFMGDASRSRISTGLGRAGARPFSSIDLPRPSFRGLSADARTQWEAADKLDREKGLNIGIIPVVDRGEMFFQDGTRLYAIGLDSGTPLPGWAKEYPGDAEGRFFFQSPSSPTDRRQQFTVTVTDHEVLAVMGQAGRTIQFPDQGASAHGETRLVCLDRQSGRRKWSVGPRDLPDQGNIRALALGGSPLVVGDNVYVCGTGGKSTQFDDCYVFCLDRATGRCKWSAYVCSAATGRVLWGGDTGPVAEVISSVAYASGRLYVLTNLGAVAALDAYSGSVVWLDTYERNATEDPRQVRFGMPHLPPMPWSYNPAVVSGGRVFALPSDGRNLVVYDAGTGQEVKRISLADLDNADTLIGVQGNRLIVSSGERVTAFNWEAFDPGNSGSIAAAIYWKQNFTRSPVRGRGFMTGDSVFIPTRERLYRIDLATGKIADPYPPLTRGPWEDPEGPGNVLVTEDKVIIAGPTRVSVYTDLAVARAKLDKQVAAAPNDPDLRLRYADMLFVAGDLKTAMQKLDEAIDLLGGMKNLAPGAARDRAFHTALTFAQKLADPKVVAPENAATINRLFDEAAAAASSASQQVEYRISRAKFAHQNRDYPAEARLYQEILGDEGMRTVALGDPDGGSSQQAAAVAEAAIDALIHQAGPEVYQPFEAAARQDMDAARAAQDPDALLRVAHRYPNASVASQAMMAAADTYESKGEPRRATQVLRQLYFKYPNAAKAPVLEAMARNYLAIPGHIEVAISRLRQGARLAGDSKLSKPLPLPDGKSLADVTFSQAVTALRQYQSAAASKSLPDFRLPAEGKALLPAEVVAGVAALVPPLQDYPRFDRLVTFTGDGQVAVYPVGGTQPLWTAKVLSDAPRQCAWVGQDVALWNSQELVLLSGDSGQPRWRAAVKSLPDIQVVRSDEGASVTDAAANANENAGERTVMVGPNGQAIRVRLVQGGIVRIVGNGRFIGPGGVIVGGNPAVPVAPAGGEQIAEVRPAGDKLIASTTTGRLFAVDLADGHLSWQTRLTTDHPIERLLATDDFAVARFSDGVNVQILALDAATGQVLRRWDKFDVDANNIPVNEALSPDGTVVISLADRMTAKDLYEPGPAANWETTPQTNGSPMFVGSEAPDQLIAADGRVLAVTDTGTFVRVYSLETGQPIRARGENGKVEVDAFLPTRARAGTPVHMRLAGPFLYVFGPQSLMAFNLDAPLDSSGDRVVPENANLRDLFIGRDYLLALDEPGVARFIGNPDAPAANLRVLAYSRATVNGRESGLLAHDPTFPDPAGITAWQPVQGGLYYLSADHKLHFLKANAK